MYFNPKLLSSKTHYIFNKQKSSTQTEEITEIEDVKPSASEHKESAFEALSKLVEQTFGNGSVDTEEKNTSYVDKVTKSRESSNTPAK